jgi:hypothetical protein
MRLTLISVLTFLLLARPALSQPERGVLRPGEPIAIGRKIALVIGNQTYPRSPLVNSINDAAAIAKTLRDLNFDSVVEKHDLGKRQMDEEIDRFGNSLRRGDLALFYYAGHGVQANDQNYLIPVDFSGSEPDLPYEAYAASRIRDKLEDSGARLRILILDACRNNPFRGKRGDTPGLSPMQSSGEGTYIAYSTADNQTADDDPKETNGLYTRQLLAALRTPGLELKEIFETARERVFRATNGRQFPYTYGGVVGKFYFSGPLTIVDNPPPVVTPAEQIIRAPNTGINLPREDQPQPIPDGRSEAVVRPQAQSGTIVWRGHVDGSLMVTVEDNHPSAGVLSGDALPAAALILLPLDRAHATLDSAPGPGNHFRRLIFTATGHGDVTVKFKWTLPAR